MENSQLELQKSNIKTIIEQLIDNGEYGEAKAVIAQYDAIIENDDTIFYYKAIISVMENSLDRAVEILQEGLSINPYNPQLCDMLGEIYDSKGYTESAEYFYGKALQSTTDSTMVERIKNRLNELNREPYNHSEKLISFVVLAYNQLEYTKLCVDSIYTYCAHLNFELITVDNGSSDETSKYFLALPNQKKISLRRNMNGSAGANNAFKIASGKYVASITNDIILTRHAIDNLIQCLESDDKIGMIVPVCNASSNMQMIPVTFENVWQMQRYATGFNYYDPLKWEERVRLITYMAVIPNTLLKRIGGCDEVNFPCAFNDDDISFRIRRLGFKLILAKDTFVYHFGSVTLRNTGDMTNNTIALYRERFIKVHGIDSWTEAIFDVEMLNKLKIGKRKDKISILGIQPDCGATVLQIKNILKAKGFKDVSITNYVDNKRFVSDLKSISNEVICDTLENMDNHLNGRRYDYIVICKTLNELKLGKNCDMFMNHLENHLQYGGQLLYRMNNQN